MPEVPTLEVFGLSETILQAQHNLQHMGTMLTDKLASVIDMSFDAQFLEIQRLELELAKLPTLLQDYDPPPVSFQLQNFHNTIDSYHDSVQNSLREMAMKSREEDTAYSAVTISSEPVSQPNVTFESFKDSFPPLQVLEMDFSGVVSTLETLFTISVVFDVIRRIIKSINIIRKYLQKTETVLPTLDLIELGDHIAAPEKEAAKNEEKERNTLLKEEQNKMPFRSFPCCCLRQRSPVVDENDKPSTDQNPESFFSKILRFPLFLVGPIFSAILIGVFLSIGVYFMLSFYIQMFRAYENGCIQSAEGGFLTFNVNSIASKIAREPGDLYLWEQHGAYDANGYTRCQRRIIEENIDVTRFRFNRTLSHNTISNINEGLSVIDKCLDFDASFSNGMIVSNRTGVVTNIPATTLSDLYNQPCSKDLASSGIWSDDYIIPMGTAGCHDIRPACSIVSHCEGPSPIHIYDAALYASCDAEWYIHAVIFRIFFFIIIYICFSVSRSLFTAFLAEYFWESLNYTTFRVLASSDLDGNPKQKLTQMALKTQIKTTMKSFRCKAIVKLIISVLIHLPYIAVILIVNFKAPPYAK